METYLFGNEPAPNTLIQPVDSHDLEGIENEVRTIRELTEADFQLIAVKVESWNRDLSPWKAPAVFGNEGFGDGATEFLDEILKLCPDGHTCFIGGYSLAGLFALWAAYRTGRFAGTAAASPSVWFPGFPESNQRCLPEPGRQGGKNPESGNGSSRKPHPGSRGHPEKPGSPLPPGMESRQPLPGCGYPDRKSLCLGAG